MLGKLNCRAAEFTHTRKANRWRFSSPLTIASLIFLAVPLLAACGNTSASPTFAGGSQASQSATGTPVSDSSLPLTVTAGGVSVTLEMVDSTSSATRFNFRLDLPAGPQSQPVNLLGDNAADDVQIGGITARPNDPYVSQSEYNTGHPHFELALDYQSPFPTDRTVAITIQRLTLPIPPATPSSAPASTREVDGPWIFQITPEMVANQPLPAPGAVDIDRFGGISIDKAQKLVDFPLIEPSPLPAPLTRKEFNVTGYALGVSQSAHANYVRFVYEPHQPSAEQDVWLVETTNDAAVPIINGDSATLLLPSGPSGITRAFPIKQGSKKTLPFGGVTVTTFETDDETTGASTIYLVWKQGDVDYYLRHVTTGDASQRRVSNPVLITMAFSLIDQGSDATPTPNDQGRYVGITFDQAQKLTPFPLFLPTYIPPSLQFSSIDVEIPPVAPMGVAKGTPTKANLYFGAVEGQSFPVMLLESGLPINPNNVGGAEVTVTNAEGTPTVMPADGVMSTFTINGITVTRHDVANNDGKIIWTYIWKQGPTSMMLTVFADTGTSDADVQHMIASMIEQVS